MTPTIWERFWIWRRRAGLSQEGAARTLGCSRGTIQKIETAMAWPVRWIGDCLLPALLSPGEEVRLMRRRSGLRAEDMAALLDVSRITLYRIERDEINLSIAEMRSIEKSIIYHQKRGCWPVPGPGQVRK